MFAYAIWDARKRRLLLARDRFGKKPLYYAVLPEVFFGSELKCLRAAGVPLAIDEEALQTPISGFPYIPDPYSAYKGVRKSYPRQDGSPSTPTGVRRARNCTGVFPEPAAVAEPGFTREEACARCAKSSTNPCGSHDRRRAPGRVPQRRHRFEPVVASMAMQSSEPVKTFSIGFEEAEFNELRVRLRRCPPV